jgi:uroporphyrin-III C-methyltransferase
VTAATAAAAELGISLSQRGVARGVVMTTPRVGVGEPNNDWSVGLNPADTVVVYMGAGKAHEVMQKLAAKGFDGRTPAVMVENATLPNRKETWCVLDTLGNTAKQSVEGPALIIIGQTLAKARHDVEPVAQSDEQIDRFLEYGNSWFR